ncbi:hypothetical protein JCM19241_4139 [Vibrio ishigakensis]|uniref:Uncharacterized protein n=1 Tax=Vibrio ishigakensis TaxID=1481914 RepID=A0A0B8QHQ1_9VIBR|nr:hypothetical protein JCM19241_4139 [Vibrio ishigakensis]
MKFLDLEINDTVFILTPIYTKQRGVSASNQQQYFLPYKVSKVTKQFFDVEGLGRFKRDDGQAHGISRFDKQAYRLGETSDDNGIVTDQSKEHAKACEIQTLIDEINYYITRYTVNHKVLQDAELKQLYSLVKKNAEQFSSFRNQVPLAANS